MAHCLYFQATTRREMHEMGKFVLSNCQQVQQMPLARQFGGSQLVPLRRGSARGGTAWRRGNWQCDISWLATFDFQESNISWWKRVMIIFNCHLVDHKEVSSNHIKEARQKLSTTFQNSNLQRKFVHDLPLFNQTEIMWNAPVWADIFWIPLQRQ